MYNKHIFGTIDFFAIVNYLEIFVLQLHGETMSQLTKYRIDVYIPSGIFYH